MKALITGGAGFIGSHLAEALLAEGDQVDVIDDLSTGSIENVRSLTDHPRFQCTTGSVLDRTLVADLVDGCDVIFHLAAAVGVRLVVKSPIHTIETNVTGTAVVLDLASKARKKVVLASTSEAYGDSADAPFREDTEVSLGPTTGSRQSYAYSKLMAECLAAAYWRERGLPVIILRLFNTVGPRQTGRYGMVVPRFVEQASAGKPLTIYADGQQTRCFAYVGDVVRGMIDLAKCPAAAGQIFNIGNDHEITIEGLARLIVDITGSTSRLDYIPYEQVYGEDFGDMRRRVPDLSKIRSFVGYRTTLDLPAIIGSVIEYGKTG